MNRSKHRFPILFAGMMAVAGATTGLQAQAASDTFDTLGRQYAEKVKPLVSRFCLKCHSAENPEGDLDLQRFGTLADIRKVSSVWVKVAEMLDNGEMPPKNARKLAGDDRLQLREWVARYLNAEALASAGDPGPVVIRRLDNAEYDYTIQELTHLALKPSREFPADGASGEGFTNTGNSLVMSPALITKYLDAGKQVASHAVLLPDGFRFSTGTSRRDWTDETLKKIRDFYGHYADQEGRLPLGPYLIATIAERDALSQGKTTIAEVAKRRKLNARYLAGLWTLLNDREPSLVLDGIRSRWIAAREADVPAIVAEIEQYQKVLSRFQSVGHMKPWVVPVTPIVAERELRHQFAATDAKEVVLYLSAVDSRNRKQGGEVVFESPRLVAPGRPPIPLSRLGTTIQQLESRREKLFSSTKQCLEAVAGAMDSGGEIDVAALAKQHSVDPELLAAWLDYLGVQGGSTVRLDLLTQPLKNLSGYAFVNGWGFPETPSLVTNSSDQEVRIPGRLKGHGVTVHPSPTHAVAVGWRSPEGGPVRVEGTVTHAHPECGNGVTWSLELRRGSVRQNLGRGVAAGAKPVTIAPVDLSDLRKGDLVSLVIGPRDGNHACDLTDVEMKIKRTDQTNHSWDLNREIADSILKSNPHPDALGHADVWHFYREPVKGNDSGREIPSGSRLARWQTSKGEDKQRAAASVQELLMKGPPPGKGNPDAELYRQLASLGGPLFAGLQQRLTQTPAEPPKAGQKWGLDPTLFGKRPGGPAIAADSLSLKAPTVVEIRLPAEMISGSELVTTARLIANPASLDDGSVQVNLSTTRPASLTTALSTEPFLVVPGGAAEKQLLRDFDHFRRWFPPALAYTKIVPVDEVVTLTLFHREDEPLQRLMLDDSERAEIDRLWDELHFVSQDALTLVDAFAQLMEYATQDSDPKLFEPYRKPIQERAAAYRKALIAAEPVQLESLIKFASLAYRRPLTDGEKLELRSLYGKLRGESIPHDEAFRFTLAKLLVAPSFLYRIEKAGPGDKPVPVTGWELANRLSYFLWSSPPDAELRELAATDQLQKPEVLAAQTGRMMRDPRMQRWARQFACQWLQIYEFDTLDEKSERTFPTFAGLRSDMYEEAIRFFAGVAERDASILDLLDADYTYLNDAMARHYGISTAAGPGWKRVEGVRSAGRGGILGLSATLAKQSGASRTSPILRGNWISEVLLGERLPRPPKDIPQLPEDEAATTLTVRELVEQHSRDVRCAGCHVKIDPLGFSLEAYDAIGRLRSKDLANRPIDTKAKAVDGTELSGLEGLRAYLVGPKRKVVVRQFCRKLLGYALGRGVQLSDQPLLDEMQAELEKHDYKLSVALTAIVKSRQFREIRGRDQVMSDAP